MSLRRKLIVAGAAFLFLVLLISSFFGKKGLVEIYQTKKKYQALLQEIERLEKEKNRLEKEISELEKNPQAVEEEARGKLWLMKPGEKTVVKKNNEDKKEKK